MEKNKNTEEELVHNFDQGSSKKTNMKPLILIVIAVILGAGSGFLISQGTAKSVSPVSQVQNSSQISKGTALGANDSKTFKDIVEGVLKVGGIEGEGQYHLERPGGPSQFVYLTSSTVDLSLVKDRKIKVWGQTQKAQHAGWLMDVGRVEVLE